MLRTELNNISLTTYIPSQVIIQAGKDDNERVLDLKRNKFLLNNCPQVVTDRIVTLLKLGLQVAVKCRDNEDLLITQNLFEKLRYTNPSIDLKEESRDEGVLFRRTNQYAVISNI